MSFNPKFHSIQFQQGKVIVESWIMATLISLSDTDETDVTDDLEDVMEDIGLNGKHH